MSSDSERTIVATSLVKLDTALAICAADGIRCNKFPGMTVKQSVSVIVDVIASAVAAVA